MADAALAAEIAGRIDALRTRIADACRAAGRDPDEIELLAVSKKHGLDRIEAAFAAGQRVFGENRVQELVRKDHEADERVRAGASLDGLRWDLIGSLQTNKVKDLVPLQPRLRYLHSLDRTKLADTLQRVFDERDPGGPPLQVLLQVHATDEESKHGVAPSDALALARHVASACPRLRLEGVMAMGPLEGDPAPVFDRVAALRDEIATALGRALPVLSLGMTGDLDAAIAAGSTMVRIGTGVFGPRPEG